MNNPFESVRVMWSATDEQFFRLADLFSTEFLCRSGNRVAPEELTAPARGQRREGEGAALR